MAAPRYPRQDCNPTFPLPYRIFPVIHNFGLTVQLLLQAALQADVSVQRHSTRSLIEILYWLVDTVFNDAFDGDRLPARRTPAQVQAVTSAGSALVIVFQSIKAAATIANIDLNPPDGLAPGEAPLELVLQTIVENGVQDFGTAWNTLQQYAVTSHLPCGMPAVGMLAVGDVTGSNTAVVTMGESDWGRFDMRNGLSDWFRKARTNTITMAEYPNYPNHVNTIHNHVNQNLGSLKLAWDNAEPGSKDHDVARAWCSAVLPRGVPGLFPGEDVNAMTFTTKRNVSAIPRCRRCRVVYRYDMVRTPVVEPERFDLGVYVDPFSCPEVSGFAKCSRYGL